MQNGCETQNDADPMLSLSQSSKCSAAATIPPEWLRLLLLFMKMGDLRVCMCVRVFFCVELF